MIEVTKDDGKRVLVNPRHITHIHTRGKETRIWLNSYSAYDGIYEQNTIDVVESYTYIKEMLERYNGQEL